MSRALVTLLFSVQLYSDSAMGALLFNGNCVTCHKPTKEISAPSMQEVQQRYRSAFSKKEDFVNYLSEWVAHPNKETSLMHDAIKKHELMPQLAYEKEVLREIASYLYEADFSAWQSLR